MGKEKLLEEALRLFSARGYEAVGVQEVVEAAGVTKPSLYHHFGSKRGLLDALLAAQYGDFQTRLAAASRYEGELPSSLLRVAQCFFEFARDHSSFYKMQQAMWYAGAESESHLVIEPFIKQQQQAVEELFTNASKDHANLRNQQTIYTITFLGMINGHLAGAPNEDMPRKAVKQFMYGIYAL
jgi:AcrR family transcriptional regulator